MLPPIPWANYRMGTLGDSRMQNPYQNIAGTKGAGAKGACFWASALSGYAFHFEPASMLAVGSSFTDERPTSFESLLHQIRYSVPQDPTHIWAILSGVNDPAAATPSISFDQTKSNILAALDLLGGMGKRVVMIGPTPRASNGAAPYSALTGTYTDPTSNLGNLYGQNQWLKLVACPPRPWVLFVDCLDQLSDTGTGDSGNHTYLPNPLYCVDGLHPGTYGGRALGQIIYNAMVAANWLPTKGSPLNQWQTVDSTWVTGSNEFGSLSLNPSLTGTTGSKTLGGTAGGTNTGNVATSFTATLTNGTGVTATWSKGTDAAGFTSQILVLSGTPTDANPSLTCGAGTVTGANTALALNQPVYGSCHMTVADGHTGLQQVQWLSNFGANPQMVLFNNALTGTDSSISTLIGAGYDPFGMCQKGWDIDIFSPIDLIHAAAPSFLLAQLSLAMIINVAVSATITFSRPALRKLPAGLTPYF